MWFIIFGRSETLMMIKAYVSQTLFHAVNKTCQREGDAVVKTKVNRIRYIFFYDTSIFYY